MFEFLSRTFSSFFSRLQGTSHFTEATLSDALAKVHDALLDADVPYAVVQAFIQEIKQEVMGQKVLASLKPSEHLMKIVHDKLLSFLGGVGSETVFSFQIPSVTMVMGLQGSGKTTTIAKLAHFIKEAAHKKGKQRSILVGSVDFYRPAAIDQLEILAKKVDVGFYRASSKDPVRAAQEIVNYAYKNSYELIFLDTAGRLHVDAPLLDELKQIDMLVKPKYKFLVLDAMTGQESLTIAQAFDQAVGFLGSILTKTDSETRAGAAFAFRYALKKPIIFVGVGEKVADLELFRPERVVRQILGMGDIVTLVEKAEEKIQHYEQEQLTRAFTQGRLTLNDFAQQMEMIGKLGSLSQIMKYFPGASDLQLSPDMIDKSEAEIKKFKAIISSMTPEERINPKVLDGSRKQRIARGAGVGVPDVNMLLDRFEQSQQLVKVFKKMKHFNGFFK